MVYETLKSQRRDANTLGIMGAHRHGQGRGGTCPLGNLKCIFLSNYSHVRNCRKQHLITAKHTVIRKSFSVSTLCLKKCTNF